MLRRKEYFMVSRRGQFAKVCKRFSRVRKFFHEAKKTAYYKGRTPARALAVNYNYILLIIFEPSENGFTNHKYLTERRVGVTWITVFVNLLIEWKCRILMFTHIPNIVVLLESLVQIICKLC